MSYGDVVQCELTPVGDTDIFTFPGQAGEVVELHVATTAGPGFPVINLFRPNGQLVSSVFSGLRRTLDASGTFRIQIVENGNNQTVGYTLALERVAPASPKSRTLAYGVLLEDELNVVGDLDMFAFSGTAGTSVSLLVATIAGPGFPVINLYDPDGALITSVFSGTTQALTKTGLHYVMISENGNNQTVTYRLDLQCISGGCGSISIPDVGVPSPSSGSGSSQIFTLQFTDADGTADLDVLNVLINNAIDGRNACYLAFVRSTNTLFLVNDAGDAGGPFAGSLTLPTTGSINNSQCTINAVGSSATTAGNQLTLALNISFAAGFPGNRVFYLAARDIGGNNTGWRAKGVWNIPGGVIPGNGTSVVSLTPTRAMTNTVTITGVFSDTSGFADLNIINILINDGIDGRNACYIAYIVSTNTLVLVNDAGDAGGPFAGSIPIPGAGSVSNGQCSINAAGSAVSMAGNNLTLTLAFTFTGSFSGERIVFAAARDLSANNTDWQPMGTIGVP
ncbi:MAG: hypothetical protein R2762_29030 [Bryobacteraceae bacterium]